MKNSRFVIYLSDVQEEAELAKWPDLLEIIRDKVKPERDQLGSNPNNVPLKKRWWAFQAHRPELYQLIRPLSRVLVNSQVSSHLSPAFLPTTWIFAHTTNIFALADNASLAVLQSRPHEFWARFFGSSMEDDLRYTPSDCFETFPFPENFETDAKLEAVGKEYYEFRAALMVQNNEGLTKTYNRFHDPHEASPDIKKLRELHAAMDRAVLDAYGWTDLQPTCEFLLDYDEEEGDEEDPRSLTVAARRKKKPWRYRWPDEFRDLVLARLLELNKQRAEAEQLSGEAVAENLKKSAKMNKKKGSSDASQDHPRLF